MRSSRFLLSGHGDLFPTSKAAAHLTPRWVLAREVPPAPGKSKCYADFTHPPHHNKFQLFTPEAHETKVVNMVDAQGGSLKHCTSQFPSARAAQAAISGVSRDVSHHTQKTNDSPLARSNIATKEAAEKLAKTRDFRPGTPAPRQKEGFELTTDYREAEAYIAERTACSIKLTNDNKSGWTKEWVPHERNPPPKPQPKK